MKYCFDKIIKDIQSDFLNYFGENALGESSVERNDFFNYLQSDNFIILYKKLATNVRDNNFVPDINVVLQPLPTPRVYKPNAHGTSFHTDHMYGHGKKSLSVWVPMFGVTRENSFSILDEGYKDEFSENNLGTSYDQNLEDELVTRSSNVDVGAGEYVVFRSTEIHGSPKNKSNVTRYSFDFRISEFDDKTSNKNLATYLHLIDGYWKNPFEKYKDRKFLKLIIGSKIISTKSQHILVNEICNTHGFTIVAQEAELERFGYPMLEQYINKNLLNKEFDSVVIASSILLDDGIISLIRDSDVDVFSAAEECFI